MNGALIPGMVGCSLHARTPRASPSNRSGMMQDQRAFATHERLNTHAHPGAVLLHGTEMASASGKLKQLAKLRRVRLRIVTPLDVTQKTKPEETSIGAHVAQRRLTNYGHIPRVAVHVRGWPREPSCHH
jgi:hypothetical protein